jgi:hypothetical protein
VSISQVLTDPNSVEMLKDDLKEENSILDKYFAENTDLTQCKQSLTGTQLEKMREQSLNTNSNKFLFPCLKLKFMERYPLSCR